MKVKPISIRFVVGGVLMCLFQMYYSVCAQTGYRFSHIDINSGLSHNQVKSLLKDSRGFVWIGALSGLNRYDGNSIKIFRNDPRDTASLADNDIFNLFEGPEGKIWVTTYAGVNVYDPATETFQRDANKVLRQYGIPDGVITDIIKDSQGNYWFIHASQGLFRYDAKEKSTLHIEQSEADTKTLSKGQLSAMAEDVDGNFWLLHRDGMLEKLDGKSYRVVYSNLELYQQYKNEVLDYGITVDSDGDLWIYFINTNKGVYHLDVSEKAMYHFNRSSQKVQLNTDIVRGVVQDNKGLIWIATDHGGINVIDKKDFSVRYILHNPDDDKSLCQNSIQVIYKDHEGFIWIGTYKKGINYYHEDVIRFQLYRQTASSASLPFNDINCFAEDDKGNIWIGTNGGGLICFDRKKGTFTSYLNDPRNPNSLSNNVIVSMCFDKSKTLWIGTYYGGLNRFDGKNFIRYRHNPADPRSISDDNIWEIVEDSNQKLWIGTLSNGMDVYDRNTNTFMHYRLGDENSVHSTYIPVIAKDLEGNMWMGSGYGVDVLDRQSGRFTHYLNDPSNPKSLSHNNIYSILDDSLGGLWIGTKEGLNLFDKKTKTFRVFRKEDGLPDNTVLTLLHDNSGNLWMSTPNGLSNLILHRGVDGSILSYEFKNYDESDGLQGKQFNEGTAFRTRGGELIFGGATGFNIFRPEDIHRNERTPDIILTELQIFNKDVRIGENINGNVVLKRSITETDEITLKHNDNVFSIEFATLSFFHPEKSLYKYRLEGFNKEWLTANSNTRRVTFTNLDPGEYTFRVKASNNDGVWNEEGKSLKITVLPPFWKTKTAFVLYIVFVLGALMLTRKLIQQRERLKFSIEQEREEAHRMHELDMMKIKFFTNVSHEFRTPLTLILTPLERILKNTQEPEQQNQFKLIHRNARRLLNLVNQLLDFRKLEVQEIRFNPSEGDIVHFIRETVFSFSDLSEKKDIRLEFQTSIPTLETIFDQDKLEKILFNLLSNAFKFTPEHGAVTVQVDCVNKEGEKWLEIKVKDTGIGVPTDKQEKIFERFFQNDLPRSMVNQGSGIGLSITREFVKSHGGKIMVESDGEQGSCFTVSIPVTDVTVHEHAPAALPVETVHAPAAEAEETAEGAPVNGAKHHRGNRSTLLLVEDNEDFRFYLKDNLSLQYNIIEARDGKEGWNQAVTLLPDLIVSDVMMPEMNGMELCKKIKNDSRVSHIPVILLTARTAAEQRLEGFEMGADDYVTKPFNFEILQSRIKNLIHQRELFQKDFRRQIEVKASNVAITSLDEKLIKNAIQIVESHIADPDFSVEDLSRELGMSRVYLYKKLLALTGKSPLEFIRTIRLQQAAQLLEKSQLTVSEVAYKVGFNNPKYFTKYFKEEYQALPSAYAAEKRMKGA